MPVLDRLSFQQLLWLVPIFLAIHNLEEAPSMARWSQRIRVPILRLVTTPQFVVAVTLLTVLGFGVTFVCLQSPPNSSGIMVVSIIQAIMLINAVAPHVAAALRYKTYNPGGDGVAHPRLARGRQSGDRLVDRTVGPSRQP